MVHPKMKFTYVGIDSHKDTHTAFFLDCFFEKLGSITLGNLPADFAAFLRETPRFKMDGTALLFGMEDVSQYGRALAQFLMANNQPVKHVNAYLIARERKNLNLEKSDFVDAECAARILISRFGNLPDAEDDERYHVLRTLVVRRDFLTRCNLMIKTYLHSLLTVDFPNYHKFFAGIGGKTSIAFFSKYTFPGMLIGISAEELSQFLREHSGGLLGMVRAKEILAALDPAATLEISEKQQVRSTIIRSTIQQLQYNIDDLEAVEIELARVFKSFNTTLTSMSGLDIVSASQLLSCIGDIRKFPTPAKLARYAGIAPISHSSGKRDMQFASQRGDRELNSLFYQLAVRLLLTFGPKHKAHNPYFYEYYKKKVSEGKTKRQAIKCVQRRLVNIVWGMLTHGEDYVNPPMVPVDRPAVEAEVRKLKAK